MEPRNDERPSALFSLFSFSEWKNKATEPNMRRVELALFFGIGIILGITLKNIATETFTIGYQDYTISRQENSIGFDNAERRALSKKSQPSDAETTNSGKSCSQE